jgi:Uma2 family endonuclease
MAVREILHTAADLWEKQGEHLELVEGEFIHMAPTGDAHGIVAAWLLHLILDCVDAHDLGEVTAAETGFILFRNPDTVRAPDVGFISKARLQPLTGGFYTVVPDLAVEVISPWDSAREVRHKALQYLQAGTRLVWIVYPDEKLIDVYQSGQSIRVFTVDDVLDGGEALPGFSVPVREIFKKLRE